jgi:FkbM family methyltransferase
VPVSADTWAVIRFVWAHPANERGRVRALFRAARFQVRGRVLGKRTRARLGEKSSVWADLHRTGASKVVYANPPDHPEMLVWRRHLRPGDLFVDVGANIGSYSIWAGEIGAEVVALEPAADTFALLEENIALNAYPIRPVRAAAGSRCGTTRITSGRDTVNRVAPSGEAEVDMVTLDSVVQDRVVAGMKIDVEGFEIEVLRGCERALSQQRVQLIQIEWNSTSLELVGTDRRPVAEFLARHGYRLCRPRADGSLAPLGGVSFGADVFALPADTPGCPGDPQTAGTRPDVAARAAAAMPAAIEPGV